MEESKEGPHFQRAIQQNFHVVLFAQSAAEGYSDLNVFVRKPNGHSLTKKAIKLSTFTVYCTVFQLFNPEPGKQGFTEISFYCRAFVSVVFESLPYPKLIVSCPAQSHLSSLCIPCVKVQVWWDLPEDGHQLLSHTPPMQTLVEKKQLLQKLLQKYKA